MKQYAIFGGSFDPFHDGHAAVSYNIMKKLNPDLLFIVPSGIHPEGKQALFSGEQRLLMLRAFFGKLTAENKNFLRKSLDPEDFEVILNAGWRNDKITICDDEIKNPSISYTIDFVKKILSKDENVSIHLFLGADQASLFGSWKNSDELSRLCKLWVIGRNNLKPDQNFSWNILPFPPISISSTQIRHNLKNGRSPEGVPKIIKILTRILN